MRPARRNNRIYTMSMTALLAAVICVLAPMAIPVGPIPITLATLAMYLALYLLGGKLGTLSCLVYVLIGLAGVPVFAGFTGGAGKLLGPTGGYIVGYVVMTWIAGGFLDRFQGRFLQAVGLAAGTAVCYALGTAWYCVSAEASVGTALALCVLPFLPGDVAKIALATTFGPAIRKRLSEAGLLEQ